MTKVRCGIFFLLALVYAAGTATAATPSNVVNVDCNQGQSLNQALAKLDKHTPTTVTVNGTCAESVQVAGFENLTLQGLPGATLAQPSTGTNSPLIILSSRNVLVIGFTVQATTASAMGIGHGSSDIQLRELNLVAGSSGINVFENSQVSIAYVTGQTEGYGAVAIYDSSDVHLEHSKFEASNPTTGWGVGIAMGASHITMYDVTITNYQVGIGAYDGSIVDMWYYSTYYKQGNSTDIKILSPAGINTNGVQVDAGGSLNVGARLVIDQAGQTWGGTTGGVLLSNGSTMGATGGNLVINASHGHGVVAMNNSHATVSGMVQGSAHGGLVVTNLSSIDVTVGTGLSTIAANSVDLFCDPNSWVTGTANIGGAPKAQCGNLLTTETAVLP